MVKSSAKKLYNNVDYLKYLRKTGFDLLIQEYMEKELQIF